jgi:hypothetical protein
VVNLLAKGPPAVICVWLLCVHFTANTPHVGANVCHFTANTPHIGENVRYVHRQLAELRHLPAKPAFPATKGRLHTSEATLEAK